MQPKGLGKFKISPHRVSNTRPSALTTRPPRAPCVCQIIEKSRECNVTVHQIFRDLKKGYDSVRKEVMYSYLITYSQRDLLQQNMTHGQL
jgi:hypothetical protein